jgi:RNA polymerase sigma-70 factor, ECF subfamily
MSSDPDIAQVDAVLSGDDSAFDDLVIRYQRPITALIVRMIGRVEDAPDIAQKVFLKAYTKLPSFRRNSTFKTWLYAIAINMSRNELRHRMRWGVPRDIDDVDPGVEDSQDDKLIANERQAHLNDAIRQLPPKQKAVLTLRVYEEMAFADIAAATEMTENSAKVNYHHAVKRLRDIMQDASEGA